MTNLCPFCKEDIGTEVDHSFNQPAPNQRLHRRYSLRTASQLKAYLRFLEANVHNVRQHVHFAQLLAFAERMIGREDEQLDWATRGGSYLEAIHHLSVEAHLLKCHRQDVEALCFRIHVKVDDWPFYAFSRQQRCNSCRHFGIASWFDDDEDRRDMARIGGFRLLDNRIQACTVHLDLGVNKSSLTPEGVVCPICDMVTVSPKDLMTGRTALHNLYFQARCCVCRFSCIEA